MDKIEMSDDEVRDILIQAVHDAMADREMSWIEEALLELDKEIVSAKSLELLEAASRG